MTIQAQNKELDTYTISGHIPDISFLVSTAGSGLLLVTGNTVSKIIDASGFYGITKEAENWWVFGYTNEKGFVISFNIDGKTGYNIQKRIEGLSYAVHQIDFVNDDLLLTDTYHNSFRVFRDIADKSLCRPDDALRILTPRGLVASRKDKNYCHINSIYCDSNKIYILAHNNTFKTGRKSEIFIYDLDYNKIDIWPTPYSSAHNFYRGDMELICDSESGTLMKNNEVAFECDDKSFTRGLSVSDDYIIVGSSGISPVREDRQYLDGNIYILDINFNRVAKIAIPKTQIMDIRRVDKSDYGLSNMERV